MLFHKKMLSCFATMILCLPWSTFASEVYEIDSAHTAVTWQISHHDFSYPTGKFMNIEGKIDYDDEDVTKSQVTLSIPVAKGQSGVAKLDEHLQGVDFFNVEKFPAATFKSTRVEKIDNNKLKVIGDLTLLGVTKPVVLFVRINKHGANMMKKDTIGFSAQSLLKRSDFGMMKYLPNLGDEVKLSIEVEANR